MPTKPPRRPCRSTQSIPMEAMTPALMDSSLSQTMATLLKRAGQLWSKVWTRWGMRELCYGKAFPKRWCLFSSSKMCYVFVQRWQECVWYKHSKSLDFKVLESSFVLVIANLQVWDFGVLKELIVSYKIQPNSITGCFPLTLQDYCIGKYISKFT